VCTYVACERWLWLGYYWALSASVCACDGCLDGNLLSASQLMLVGFYHVYWYEHFDSLFESIRRFFQTNRLEFIRFVWKITSLSCIFCYSALARASAALSIASCLSVRLVPPISRSRKDVEASNLVETQCWTRVGLTREANLRFKGQRSRSLLTKIETRFSRTSSSKVDTFASNQDQV